MNRRRFLAALAAVPFAPAALRGWAEERAYAEPRPTAGPPMLAAAMGEPLAVTVTVPPGRLIRLAGSLTLARGGTVWLREGDVALAGHSQIEAGYVELDCVLRPTAGSHTYRLMTVAPVADRLGALVVTDLGSE